MSGVRHLYVHLPFCGHRCGYCAFVVEVGALDRRDAYLDALIGELTQEGDRLGALETVYLGGGTPSLMEPRRVARLLDAIAPWCAPDVEVSMEANPETLDVGVLRDFREAGVTRLSMGAQSFQPHLLRALDRRATAERVRGAVDEARAAGFENLSLDLLFGVPGQTHADLEADLAAVTEIAPEHISWYELEIKPGSTLAREGAEVDEDFTDDAYLRIVERLEELGYRWYETANFARPGRESRHNRAYWGADDYVGIGIGAVSTVDGLRWRNAPDLDGYITAIAEGRTPRRTSEPLSDATRRRERWMLAFRLSEPVSLANLGSPDHPEALDDLVDGGLIRRLDEDRIELTREGRYLQNSVLAHLIDF